MDSDLNYFIFQQEGHLFQSWYPDTFTEIFVGPLHGFMYKYLKKMLPEVERTSITNLHNWSFHSTVVAHRSHRSGFDVLRNNLPCTHLCNQISRRQSTGLARINCVGASRNFMAFGGGMRFCVGADFNKLQMPVFLHCFVTKYKCKAVKGGEMLRTPGLQFHNGYHLQISSKNDPYAGN